MGSLATHRTLTTWCHLYISRSSCVNNVTRVRLLSSVKTKSKENQTKWQHVIGLEIHAKLQTKSKLFSGSSTTFSAPVNSQVAYLDAALPGTLPVLNKECIKAGVKTALALRCQVNMVSLFDRKHYFYADLPAGYQITQQRKPLGQGGLVDYVVFNPSAGITKPLQRQARIIQLQIEQDSGKSLHDADENISLIDLNRAGIGLMEIVTEPDFQSGEEAAAFIKELQLMVQTIGTCDGIMAEGSMRVDASISLHQPGEPYGTRREVKNINSIRNIVKAIDYEISAQKEILENGDEVENETRAFDHETGQTIAMRDKEKIHDYRFLPEPNLPPLRLYRDKDLKDLNIDESQVINVDELARSLPQLPQQRRDDLQEKYGLRLDQAITLVNEPGMQSVFEELITNRPDSIRMTYNFMKNEILELYNKQEISFYESPLKTEQISELLGLLENKTISLTAAKKVLYGLFYGESDSASSLVEEYGLSLIVNEDVICKICTDILDKNPNAVSDYAKGKKKIINFLMGQVQRETRGRADPKVTTQVLTQLLNDKR